MIKILVGLPSYNECETIQKVTKDIDNSLQELNDKVEAVIVNADGGSTDGTRELFMDTITKHKKYSFVTDGRGKGSNLYRMMEFGKEIGVDAAIFIDSDLAEIPSTWFDGWVDAIVLGKYDAVYSKRQPLWNGGDLSYHLGHPVLTSVFGANLSSPFCGEIAVSSKMIDAALSHKWPEGARGHGSDFFMATLAVKHKWCEVVLEPRRRNKLRSFSPDTDQGITMGSKFREVIETIRDCCHKAFNEAPPNYTALHIHGIHNWPLTTMPVDDNEISDLSESTYERIVKISPQGKLSDHLCRDIQQYLDRQPYQGLSWELWQRILMEWLARSYNKQSVLSISEMEIYFLSRVVGHHRENRGTDEWYRTLEQQAYSMFMSRNEMWNLIAKDINGVE